MFSTHANTAPSTRYGKLENTAAHAGGTVGIGDGKRGPMLVYVPVGAAPEAISLGAVATAIAGGTIPPDALVSAFRETGNLGKLREAVNKKD